MSKARNLADLLSDGAELADGQISVAEVVGAAPLASPTFTGTVTSTGNIALGDDDELVLGSNRMRLYYSASNNYTVLDSNGTSGFVFDGVNNLSVNIGGSLSGAFTANGVSLYSGGTEKLQVYGSGTIALDDIKVNDDVKIGFGQFHTDLELYHDSATSTNKLVGDLTQTGKLSTEELDLNAIAATISDTAVDIFVYDTRKDSDGGAWRKRTQHTSWYNEAASATRGSRKEFPAVAVIVLEADELTIYDGDDPDLPMWMVFDCADNVDMIRDTSSAGLNAISFTNAIMAVACNGGPTVINFIKETATYYNTSASYNYKGNIEQRNDAANVQQVGSTGVVNITVNDIAMTVLPNAPIDASTGLPVPTIAVATDGGYSIIKDDGTVVDGTCSQSLHNRVQKIKFTKDNRLAYLGFDYNLQNRSRVWRVDDIISADTVITTSAVAAQNSAEFYGNANGIVSSDKLLKISVNPSDYTYAGYVEANENTFVAGNNEGVSLVDRNKTKPSDGMVSFLASSYQTGYQVGDIKLATLSDTDATNVTGSELVTNGDFADTSSWSLSGTGASFAVNGSNQAVLTRNGNSARLQQSISGLTVGKAYTVSFDLVATSGSASVLVEFAGSTSGTTNTTGTISFTGIASVTTHTLIFSTMNTASGTLTFDNVSIRLAEEDRSVNGNGLQVFGTVTKSAVATGADLVGYSGFSASNYLEQPYNSDLDFGTGDFCVMGWVKRASGTYATGVLLGRKDSSNTDGYVIFTDASNNTNFYTREGTVNSVLTSSFNVSDGTWHHITAVRTSSGTVQLLYIDGRLVQSASVTARNVSNSTAKCRLGLEAENTNAPFTSGSLALWRISATAPSPEQIAKIYEDEKFLFQENAQATLYGSSDAVTALAYDDSTNLLHVGTSAGRSVFQGLRRVDNTTTAVGAAISASNGLVADE